MIFILILLAIVIGTLMPIQAGLNAQLTKFLGQPYLGALISLFTGVIAVSLLILIRGDGFSELKRVTEAPPHLFLGGILGAIFVASSLFFIPKMGATVMVAAFITGQLIGSVIIDRYGFMGLPVSPISTTRMMGIILLFAGLFLVVKKDA